MPIKSTKFFQREWGHVNTCIPGNVRYGAMNHAKWALSCIQSDLRHRLARAPGTTFFDKHNAVRLQTVIRCDEGGWVRVDDLVRNEILWTHRIRELTASAAIRDEDQRSRIYFERVQLLIDGNYLNAKQAQRCKDPIAIYWSQSEGSTCWAFQPWTSNVKHAGVKGRPDRRIATSSKHQECAPMDRALRRLGTTMGCQSGQWPFDAS